MIYYLDIVGKMHTSSAGNAQIEVPLVQMNAFMGRLSVILTQTILDLDLDEGTKYKTLQAFNKLIWIQNDLISRHYQSEGKDS